MRNSYDLLVQAQSANSLKSLDIEDVFAFLQGEEQFDISSRLWERLAFLIHQDSSFGLIPPTPPAQKILSIINRLCKSSITAGFPADGETFVGPSKSTDNPSCAQERIIYASLISSPQEDIPGVLSSFASSYPTTASFAQKLLNNDERFLTSMLILLPLVETLQTDSVFHPVGVFLEAMHLIDYDCSVLIDWLNSELAASSLILRILKSCCNPKTEHVWKGYTPKKVEQNETICKFQEEQIPNDTPPIILKVSEVIGDQEMTKILKFSAKKNKKTEDIVPNFVRNAGSFQRWINTVDGLRTRLRKLHEAKLVAEKFNLILKCADSFCTHFTNK